MFFTRPKMNAEYLNKAYKYGVEIVDVLGEDEALEMIESIECTNPQIFNDMTDIISNNPELNNRIEQLMALQCDCEDDFSIGWSFPVICLLLIPFLWIAMSAWITYHIEWPIIIMEFIGERLNCFWG